MTTIADQYIDADGFLFALVASEEEGEGRCIELDPHTNYIVVGTNAYARVKSLAEKFNEKHPCMSQKDTDAMTKMLLGGK